MRAVVIGAGPNGLAAAIRLAEAGAEVLVCEAQDAPGGGVRSQALTLDGFVHDTFSAVHPAAVASPVFARMPLARHGLEWVHPSACLANPLPDGRAAVLYRSLDATAASLDALHPGDGAAWAAFAGPILRHFDGVRDTMLAGFPPLAGAARLLAGGRAARFLTVLPQSSRGFAGRMFTSEAARGWLHGSAMHGDTPLDEPGSAIGGAYLNLLGHAVGWPSPRGGAGRLTDALVAHLGELGGAVRTGARVQRVLGDGRVRGVELSGGERLDADVVVADVMPHALARMAGFGGTYGSLLRRYRYGPTTTKVDWALDAPIPWTNAETRGAGTVHLTEPEFVLIGQQSVADPSRAPAGKHTAWAYTHAGGGPDAIEARIEALAPGFGEHVLARSVLGPDELQARDENLVGGDVGGGSYVLRQAVLRPVPRWSPYTTPMRGLFLGSAAAFPGGAVHGVPGDAAARAALKRA